VRRGWWLNIRATASGFNVSISHRAHRALLRFFSQYGKSINIRAAASGFNVSISYRARRALLRLFSRCEEIIDIRAAASGSYGVALVSGIDKITSLFCKRDL